jgi:hypothetical protein
LKLGECGKNHLKKDGKLIELVLMNLRTPFDVFMSTFFTNWKAHKEERVEAASGGFQLIESRGKCSVIQKLVYIIFIHVCGCQWRQARIYMGKLKESCIHLKKNVV